MRDFAIALRDHRSAIEHCFTCLQAWMLFEMRKLLKKVTA
jgi:hypothetical protein